MKRYGIRRQDSKAHERWGQPGPTARETKALDRTLHSIPRPSSPHQVRAADADVDDIRDGLARVPLPVTASDMLVESRCDQPKPLRVSCCSKYHFSCTLTSQSQLSGPCRGLPSGRSTGGRSLPHLPSTISSVAKRGDIPAA